MKLTCILEKRIPEIGEPIKRFAQDFKGADCVYELWDDPAEDDISAVFRRIEINGPDAEPIPEGFAKNPDTEILVGSFCPFSGKGMDVFERLRIIGVVRAGMENIDVEAATKRGIAVVNAAGRNADAVSDFTIGMMLSEARNIARAHHSIMNGGWQLNFSNSATVPDMRNKTVGLFGFGYIGKLMAEKLAGFHVKLLVFDPYISEDVVEPFGGRLVDKETLFSESDFISIHARLTPESRHAVGKSEISLMKSTAYFINTARAGLVDYEALYEALEKHKIAGAALDVFEEEPLTENSAFRKLDNVTLTTHRAGATLDAALNSPRLVFERIQNLIRGKEITGLANPEILNNESFEEWRKKAKLYLNL
ncbi:2-hydroxyacid dehydrogenase [Mediterraneibacter hominis]|nr:2-hydroxyacid dehydrogenase [Mediterraneibacter hominis]